MVPFVRSGVKQDSTILVKVVCLVLEFLLLYVQRGKPISRGTPKREKRVWLWPRSMAVATLGVFMESLLFWKRGFRNPALISYGAAGVCILISSASILLCYSLGTRSQYSHEAADVTNP